jgi:hypothetical protein
MRKLSTIIVGVAAWLAFASSARANIVEYVSQHPVPHKYGGGFCNIDVAHVHNYQPDDPRMYRQIGDKVYFVGDPTPFQYEGPRYSYYGAHPVVDAEARFDHPVYCYMKGPHYHWYQPPTGAQFQLTGGAYWYVGTFPHSYYEDRPRFAVVNEAYAPVHYARPVVDIHVAPPVVQAEIAVGGPGWRAGAVVGGPAVPFFVPPVAPVPVIVPPMVPVPVGVGIGVGVDVGFPGPMMVGGHYHDHGRHEGWRGPDHFQDHGHRGPPSRFVAGPAPAPRPFFGHGGPQPRTEPHHGIPMRGPGPGPTHPNRHR